MFQRYSEAQGHMYYMLPPMRRVVGLGVLRVNTTARAPWASQYVGALLTSEFCLPVLEVLLIRGYMDPRYKPV